MRIFQYKKTLINSPGDLTTRKQPNKNIYWYRAETPFTTMVYLYSLHGQVIICTANCGINNDEMCVPSRESPIYKVISSIMKRGLKLLVHSQISTIAPLTVGNWSICYALWAKRKPIVQPTLYSTHNSFIPSQSTFTFLKCGHQKFDLENPRSRSWVR